MDKEAFKKRLIELCVEAEVSLRRWGDGEEIDWEFFGDDWLLPLDRELANEIDDANDCGKRGVSVSEKQEKIVDQFFEGRINRPTKPADFPNEDRGDRTILGLDLIRTCQGCPEQYDVFANNLPVGYIRLRHGRLSVDAPYCGGESVMETIADEDFGEFRDEELREMSLRCCISNLVQWWNLKLAKDGE